MVKKFLLCLMMNWITVCIVYATPIYSYFDRFHPEIAQKGMVSTQEALATKVGVDILKKV